MFSVVLGAVIDLLLRVMVKIVVFNATFNNILVIL